jgi:hypothetical protein
MSVVRNILSLVTSEKGRQPLAVTHPELAKEANGWDPKEVTKGMHQILEWICAEGHTWKTSVVHRTDKNRPSGCPFCSGFKTLKGFNDLATTHPDLAAQADGWDPTAVSPGSSKSVAWRCSNNHKWKAIIVSRTRKRAADCPYCTNRKLLKGFNDLQTTHPEIAAEADGWDPATVTRGMDKPRKWKCSSGHVWTTDVLVRTRGSGCPSCAPTGYDPNTPAYLYFLNHPDWEMFQIGITNDIDTRMHSHGLLGWQCVEFRGPMDALICREWESSILRVLKAKGADLSNAKIAGKFDGYSEAWSKSTFEVSSIKELMRLVEEFENND